MITRLLAIIPAVIAVIFFGQAGTAKLLIFSQVILSLQLSFAVVPLVIFTSDRRLMGEFVNPRWLKILAWITAGDHRDTECVFFGGDGSRLDEVIGSSSH